MAEDRAMWLRALEHYRAWNEAKFADRVRRAGQRSPAEKWRAYLDLIAFGRRIRPQPSEWEQKRKVEALLTYYARLQRFEERRKQRG